ncbi:unnamed protein product [Ophioblennius macclurei]
MLFLILLGLFAVGCVGAKPWMTLTCPLEEEHRGLPMVWCHWTYSDCCSGVSFGPVNGLLNHGKLKVTQYPKFFVVEILELELGDGMYWCGRLGGNGTIIKLAEQYIYSSFGLYLWGFARWTLIPLLPLMIIFINCIYFRTPPESIRK